jgi:hypothetical protein
MSQALISRLETVEVDEPVAAGGLQVFPLRWRPGEPLNYATLDDGLASGLLEVTEIAESGSVPALKVTNKGDAPAFLMAGEQLSGGKQNRVLNASILVAPHSELPIPVSCVERGRWAYRSARFGSAGSSSHGRLRKMMHSQATLSYRLSGKPSSDQGQVWKEVDRKMAETGSHSDTLMLQQVYEDTEKALAPVAEQLKAPEGANGAVFAYGGRIAGFDLFDQSATLAKLWPKLVRAYAVDAWAEAEAAPVTRDAVREWLRGAPGATEQKFKSPGLGEDVRMEGATLSAAGLVLDDHPIHIEAFANEPAPAEAGQAAQETAAV